MARKASGKFNLDVSIREENTGQGVGNVTVPALHVQQYSDDLENGTAVGQIDRVFSGALTVTTVQSLDLSGVLSSVAGAGTVSFVKLTGFVIRNKGTTDLLVGGAANQIPLFGGATEPLRVPPGIIAGSFSGAGITVTNSTGDKISFTADSGSIPVEVELWGRSA